MNQKPLEELGLSPNEAKIYETLVERGELGVGEIATHAQIHRRNAYDAMRRLIDKGLCFEIFSGKENRYGAVEPGKLLELAEEKRRSIEVILPELNRKFHTRNTQEEAYLYRGLEGQKNIWRDLLRVGEDSYFIGGKGGWFDPRLTAAREAFFRETARKKITFHQLYDAEAAAHPANFAKQFSAAVEYRVLPKEYSTRSAIHIFGDYVVTYTGLEEIGKTPDNVVFFVMRSATLAKSYRTWFEYMWKQSKKIS